MGEIIARVCANCGRKFLTRDKTKIYCDCRCEEFAKDGIKVEQIDFVRVTQCHSTLKTCLFCGEYFKRGAEESERSFLKRKCCCRSCRQKLRQLQKKEANR